MIDHVPVLFSKNLHSRRLRQCLLVWACIVSQGVAAQDHLEPAEGPYVSESFKKTYNDLVRKTLLTGLADRPTARVIVFPSFSPEYLVSIEVDHPEYYLVFRTCDKSIWNSKSKEKEAEALKLIEKKVKISKEIAQRLNEVVFITISQSRYPPIEYLTMTGPGPVSSTAMVFPIRVDGTTYHCMASVTDSNVRSGKTYSPKEGSVMAALVNVVEKMASVAKGDRGEVALSVAVEELSKRVKTE